VAAATGLSPQGLCSLEGQAAIVTGASAGLGEMMAHGLAGAGCAVLLAARRQDRLAAVAAAIGSAAGRAVAHPVDLRGPGHPNELVAAAAFGRLDGVILNAAAFDDVMRVNVGAQAALAAAAAGPAPAPGWRPTPPRRSPSRGPRASWPASGRPTASASTPWRPAASPPGQVLPLDGGMSCW
jgi:NAD(P)-dependent dehydrogenase (short-subunit alcohol dehydrogenase family)